MIENMFELLFSPFSSIFDLLDWVIKYFEDILYVYDLLKAFTSNIPTYFEWLPDSLSVVIQILISVAVIYKILGREG